MSSKLSQSIAVQRQIPEHVRETYPAFVEFVKVYYGWLEDTQSQNLESIRDVDTTLDEFINNFKSELAKNLPIEFAEDPRKLLKHLREFYLSRGSEDSFKFLFRTLFNKEASLFYPSTQVLRVSDGKWKQDVSIYVEMTGNTTTLTPVNGTFITIQTPKKKIQTYVENVLEYSITVFEIFIQRDYLNEIEIGSIVSATIDGVTYTGKILPCPSKIKIFKAGKGFKIGDLYALKTSLGRGCVIKITKINSDGGIKAFQIIRFGLDYKTTFYSYLSSKDILAWEYIHPLKIGPGQSDVKSYIAATAGTSTYNLGYIIENNIPLVTLEVTRNGILVSPTPSFTATNGASITINNLEVGDVIIANGILVKGIPPTTDNKTYTVTGIISTTVYQTFSVNYAINQDVPSLEVKITRSGQTFVPKRYEATTGFNVNIYDLQNGDVVTLRGLSNPSYIENSGGFVDYGFASKQTYFFYDETIPVGAPDNRSDRFFADPSYVGEIVQQFYADTTQKVIDEDLAIIEINLGAVAKYPGYYLKADGFISDEMYIHDGKYYQAFSYVIKVEEELRKYADIVKSLLHPAGMRGYSEYSIFNTLQLSLVSSNPLRLLQFSDIEPVYDGGYGYDNYAVTFNGLYSIDGSSKLFSDVSISLVEGANQVFSSQGKLAYFATKNLFESVTQPYIYQDGTNAGSLLSSTGNVTPPKVYTKNLLIDAVSTSYTYQDGTNAGSLLPDTGNVTPPKFVDKIVPVNASGNISLNANGERIGDLAIPQDAGFNYDAYTISLTGTVVTHTPNGSPVISDSGRPALITSKLHIDSVSLTELDATTGLLIPKAFTKNMPEETLNVPDTYPKAFTKNMPEEILSITNEIINKDYFKDMPLETLIVTDPLSNFTTKNLPEDTVSTPDTYFNTPELIKSNDVTLIDDGKPVLTKLDTPELFATHTYQNLYDKNHVETLTLSNPLLGHDITKNHVESLISADAYSSEQIKNLPKELLSLIDAYSVGEFSKNLIDSIIAQEASYVKDYTKGPSDSINILSPGLIRLNSYGDDDPSSGYFVPLSDYNAFTAIT